MAGAFLAAKQYSRTGFQRWGGKNEHLTLLILAVAGNSREGANRAVCFRENFILQFYRGWLGSKKNEKITLRKNMKVLTIPD